MGLRPANCPRCDGAMDIWGCEKCGWAGSNIPVFELSTERLWCEIEQYRPVPIGRPAAGITDESFLRRDKFTKSFAWAYPTRDAIDAIVAFADGATILEVGAGLGLWARLLRDHGASVIATDKKPGYTWSHTNRHVGTFTKVEKLTAAASVTKYPEADVLMLCWPPYSMPMAYASLKNFKGSRVVYIGEGDGGCTADDKFHGLLDRNFSHSWVEIPRYWGIHDAIMLCTRNAE